MAEMITSFDLFEAFYEDCKQLDIEDVIKKYGGDALYIPSYKGTCRDKEIIADYKAGMTMSEMRQKHNLSASRLRQILKEFREPELF